MRSKSYKLIHFIGTFTCVLNYAWRRDYFLMVPSRERSKSKSRGREQSTSMHLSERTRQSRDRVQSTSISARDKTAWNLRHRVS